MSLGYTGCRFFPTTSLRRHLSTEVLSPHGSLLTALTPKRITTKCQNGISISTIDDLGPASSLIFRVPCGSRFESKSNSGVSHFLKNFMFCNTTNQTPVRIAREIDLRSIKLEVHLDREYLDFRASFERDELDFVVPLIADVVQNTKFNHWEFDLARTKVEEEAALVWRHPAKAALEVAHHLAFRDGLGNSPVALACNQVRLRDVVKYADAHLGFSPSAQWAGVGVDAEELKQLCESNAKCTLPTTPATSPSATTYYGGTESRMDLPGPSNVTLVFPAPSMANKKQVAAFQALRSLACPTPRVKWGQRAFPMAEGPLSAFLRTYSDHGLFGIASTCDVPEACTHAIQSCLDQFRKMAGGKVDKVHLQRAISQAKFEALHESKMGLAQQLASSQLDLVDAFDQLAESDLVKSIEALLKSKPTLVVAGKIHSLPYLDTLKFL